MSFASKIEKKKNKQTNKSVQETDKKLNINQQLIYVISGNKLIQKKNQIIYHKYLIQCTSFSTIYDSFAGLIFFLMFYLTLTTIPFYYSKERFHSSRDTMNYT